MRELVVISIIFRFFFYCYHCFFLKNILQDVLFEIVENLAPSHYVDAFNGNDVLINGVIPNGGHEVFVI
jgi:hypothetical protein